MPEAAADGPAADHVVVAALLPLVTMLALEALVFRQHSNRSKKVIEQALMILI